MKSNILLSKMKVSIKSMVKDALQTFSSKPSTGKAGEKPEARLSYAKFIEFVQDTIGVAMKEQCIPQDTIDAFLHELGCLHMEGKDIGKDYTTVCSQGEDGYAIVGIDMDMAILRWREWGSDFVVVKRGKPSEIFDPDALEEIEELVREIRTRVRGTP